VDCFDNMRVFAKVVESGSFPAAAARLNISASMVSQHVKELEERLGARLLNRTTRKVSLTETGRAYYERCTRLLADLEETKQAVSDMHAAPRGGFGVNAAPTFGILQLAPAIADFTARFPAISVELMLSIRIADLIDEGFDVAVWVGELADSTLVARQLAPCRMVVCGAPSYFEKHGTPRTPDDLTNHNCLTVAVTGLSYYRAWHLTAADGTALNISPIGNLAHQQRGGAQSPGARRTRPGVSPDLFRRRCAAVGAAGDGAGRLHSAAANAARPLSAQPPSIG
jgi:DNA-binding transcriptional LysR family regulator